MTIVRQHAEGLKEKFDQVHKILQEGYKVDKLEDPTKPYRDCRNTLDTALADVLSLINDVENNSEEYATFEVVKGFIYKEIGRVEILLDDRIIAVENLNQSLEILKDRHMDSKAVIHVVAALVELGLSASSIKNYVEARQHLESAEKIYKDFKATQETPVTIFELISSSDDIEKREGRVELGKLYTLITYYLAQVFSHLEEAEKSAAYFHITLKRQLEADDYAPIDWSLNAATLSQYYLTPNRFTEARLHLAAATHMMLEYEQKMLNPEMNHEEEQAALETFNHRFADIARCWTKYALSLLIASKERLMSEEEVPKVASKAGPTVNKFASLELQPFDVSDRFCLTFDDTKPVYHFAIKWIERSKQYYNVDLEATEYAKIVTDEADLYKLMAFFEEDPHVQCKYYKKRVDLFEHILDRLNPVFYLLICRQAWFEVALGYSTMMDTKSDILKATEDPTPHQRKKINTLAEKAIIHLQSLIGSYKDNSVIPDDEMNIFLCAHFYIGRLFYKILTPDRVQQLKNLRLSYRYYNQFVLKCKENEEASTHLKAEIGVCKEMLELLPLKIQSLAKEVGECN